MNARQNATLGSALTSTNNGINALAKGNNSINASALNLANNQPGNANLNAKRAANNFGNGYKQLTNSAAKLNQLAKQMANTGNKAAANKIRTAAAYMTRAGVATAQAKISYALVNIGKGVETMAGISNAPKTPSM